MKLLRQVSLFFQAGRSDKAYEVDLCEVGPGQYVVNFRYGRRGTALRDGTKTPLPVSQAEAERIFQALVHSKRTKGYVEEGEAPKLRQTSTSRRQIPDDGRRRQGREQAILTRLREGLDSQSRWPLDRAVWRAGELKLREAVPLILDFAGHGNDLREYCIAWALGRCGDPAPIALLERLTGSAVYSDAVRRIATHALLALSKGDSRESLLTKLRAELPASVRQALDTESAEGLELMIREHLRGASFEAYALLDTLYLLAIDEGTPRQVLLGLIRTLPLAPNNFQRLRHIFKAAEFWDDAEVFGILAHRFEKERARHASFSFYTAVDGAWIDASKEVRKKDSRVAYSEATRTYLRRRTVRTLRRVGGRGDAEAFVRMAVGVLLPYSDNDAQPARTASTYDYEADRMRRTHYDTFAPFLAFNYLLYANSPRYEPGRAGRAWRCQRNYQPGKPEPVMREEAFPELWDREPHGLLHLLSDSACAPVHAFAAKALRANERFCEQLDTSALAMLLSRPYQPTARLGLDLARRRYDPRQPDHELIGALLDAEIEEARIQGREWIEANRRHFIEDTGFVVRVIMNRHADVRIWARRLLATTLLPSAQTEALIARVISALLALDHRAEGSVEIAADTAQTLIEAVAQPLRTLGMEVIRDLLRHELAPLQALAGKILLGHSSRAEDVPEDILTALLEAATPEVRTSGVRLFGSLPDSVLIGRRETFLVLCLSPLADLRQTVRPVVARLAAQDTEFATELAASLIPHLLRKERHEGMHADLLKILKEDLTAAVRALDKETIWWLLNGKTRASGELGEWLLRECLVADDLSVKQLARLMNHENVVVRQTARELCRQSVERFETHLGDGLGILDSKWEDTRAFAFEFFESHFGAKHWTPTLLVSVCDSVRPDIQQFGRRLITRFFEDASGSEYLLKLSEHPSEDMQLFATNYLERFAAGDSGRILALSPYFAAVLSRVNRARVAKDRILRFLRAEALRNEEIARIVGELLARISATMAIGDRAACLEAMVEIRQVAPNVALPVTVKPIVARPVKAEVGKHAV
jgi:predicted DNA-binding WGR domain protein